MGVRGREAPHGLPTLVKRSVAWRMRREVAAKGRSREGCPAQLTLLIQSESKKSNAKQLLTTDLLALATMKNAAKCDT